MIKIILSRPDLDNLLLVDIYNRAKKLHIETEVRRVVFLVETNREKDGNELEKIPGDIFGGKSKGFRHSGRWKKTLL